MGLGRKNLVYSMALAGVMLTFLVGYFICMLPSLYVDHVMEENLRSVRQQHESYMENGTYEEAQVRNSAACFSVELPAEGERILISGKAFTVEILARDERLSNLLKHVRGQLELEGVTDGEGEKWKEALEEAGKVFEEVFQRQGAEGSLPVEVNLLYQRDMEGVFSQESVRIHRYSDHMLVIEASVKERGNQYTNYIAIEQTQGRLVFSCLPVVTPDMDEIRPVVLQSLPMLGAVILLIVLLFSQVYSRGIVTPVVELVGHAGQMKNGSGQEVERLSEKWPRRHDEVRELADTLDDFYQQIRASYVSLEEKNRELAEENERKEIFLRASSHQLKTPIAAALLLVDGMIGQVGRYQDTKEYLPKVKAELLSMRKIVEDILYLNRCPEGGRLWRLDMAQLLRQRLQEYQVEIGEKGLLVEITGEAQLWEDTDEVMMGRILDNLLSNAVKYTPEEGRIEIALCREEKKWQIRVENFGVTIPEDILPHIFEPFVSGEAAEKGRGRSGESGRERRPESPGAGNPSHGLSNPSHGLGLYIAAYDAGKLGLSLTVENGENSVEAVLRKI